MPRLAMAFDLAEDEPPPPSSVEMKILPFSSAACRTCQHCRSQQHHSVRRTECLHRGEAGCFLLLIGQVMGAGEGNESESLAAGMDVEDEIRQGQQDALEIVGDFLGHRAVGPARKRPVEIAESIGEVRVAARKAG